MPSQDDSILFFAYPCPAGRTSAVCSRAAKRPCATLYKRRRTVSGKSTTATLMNKNAIALVSSRRTVPFSERQGSRPLPLNGEEE